MSPSQISTLLSNIPLSTPKPPSCHIDSPIDHDIILKETSLAIPTVSGWRFKAGQTYVHAKQTWFSISPHNEIVYAQLTRGWKAPTFCQLKPAWFSSLPFSKEEQSAWDKEVISLWQMGAVQMVDQEWVKQWGLPIVVMPIFLVKEPNKYRPIVDLSIQPEVVCTPNYLRFHGITPKRCLLVQN